MEHLVNLLALLSFWLAVYSVLAALAAVVQWGQGRWLANNGLWHSRHWRKGG